MEAALFQLTGTPIRVLGAGRTDAGVHAIGQVCHCDVPGRNWDWQKRLNAVLPQAIRILGAEKADPAFHARRDATGKIYIYDLWPEQAFVAPLWRNRVFQCGSLDLTAIRSGLQLFLGEHDFASFQNSGTEIQSTRRIITDIRLAELPGPDYFPACAPALRLTITGNGFLKQMVRNMIGFMLWIGRHKSSWEALPAILAAKKRSALPSPAAPALGLTLARVLY